MIYRGFGVVVVRMLEDVVVMCKEGEGDEWWLWIRRRHCGLGWNLDYGVKG